VLFIYFHPIFNIGKNLFKNIKIILINIDELKIQFNSTLSCTELYKHILASEELLKAIKSDEKYIFNNYINVMFLL